jgi:Retrotransposon gag protein/Zinc knuckle
MDEERVSALEQQLARFEAEKADLQDKLNVLYNHVTDPRNPNPLHPALPIVPPKINRIARPSTPLDFDGDRSKGVAFLNSCQTYIRLCADEFPDDQTKIVWAMSYMKTGRAQRWTARIFRWEQLEENENQSKFLDWEEFRDEFRKEFTPAHSDALAINRLESSAYYQRNRPLDDYIDEFQDLVVDSGYTDPKTIVVKFRRGLNTQIQNVVATMAAGRPSDAKPKEWYNMARTVDQNRAANEAFSSSSRSPLPTSRPTTTSVFRPTPTVNRTGHSHIQPTPGNPVPMDLDSAQQTDVGALCFRCKKPGHFGKNCPDRFDIRNLTTDELQEALEFRLAQLDVAPPEPLAEDESETNEGF